MAERSDRKLHIEAGVIGFVDDFQASRRVLPEDCLRTREPESADPNGQDLLDRLVFDLEAGIGNYLVEDALRVAEASVTRLGDPGQPRVAEPDAFGCRDLFQIVGDDLIGSAGSRSTGSGRGSSPGPSGPRSWRR